MNNYYEVLDNCFDEIQKNNSNYANLKAEKEQLYEQLQKIAPSELFDCYVENQYAIASLELDFCYSYGMYISDKPKKTDSISDSILHGLYKSAENKHLQIETQKLYSELIMGLLPEYYVILIRYVKKWNEILEIERHYFYMGGVRNKEKMDELFKSLM